ncbi:MAG: hypothetical protein N2512_03270, partial [Armatimonadetes bacterium]|nr:hypothetical protein [Armatimonadota bacterium]
MSRPLSKEAAELLVSICLRTANPWFVRWAVQRLAMDWASELPKLQKVVAQRRDRLLAGAFQIGLIAADPGRFLDRLKRYLSPEVDTVLQELALTVREGLKLEEARALLRQWVGSASVRRRTAALRTIEHGRLVEFAGDALRAWVFDPSPSVRYRAWWAMVAVGGALGGHMSAVCKEAAGRLIDAGQRLMELVVDSSASRQTLEPARKALAAATESVRRAYGACLIAEDSSYGVLAGVLAAVYRAVVHVAHALAELCEQDKAWEVCEELPSLAEDLLSFELSLVQQMWALGGREARLPALELAGHCTVALHDRLPEAPPVRDELDWHGLIAMLRSACRKLHYRREALRDFRPQRGDPLCRWPLVSLCAARVAVQKLMLTAPKLGGAVEGKVLAALEHSLRREEQARRRLYRQVASEAIALRQTAYNDLPLTLLHRDVWLIGEALARGAAALLDERRGQADASDIFVEQLFQEALLGVLSQVTSTKSTRLLIACLSSPSAVVRECAERLLVQLGKAALPGLVDVLRKAEDPALRARLLEVGRCIDARSVLDAARAALASDDPVLCAVAVKVIGAAGEQVEAPAVRARFGQLDELVDVCVLQALAALAPEDHWELFVEAVGSVYPGTAWAGAQALGRCPPEVLAQARERLRSSNNWFHREAADALFDEEGHFRPPGQQFVGVAFPAGGDALLGARIADRGPYPWQWGIPVLLAYGDLHPELYASLITSDQGLASQWRRYSLDRSLPDDFLPRLRKIFLGGEKEAAQKASLCLYEVLGGDVRPYVQAFLAYHGLEPNERTMGRITEAFVLALDECTPERVDSLVRPNPSISNPLSDPFAIPCPENASLQFGCAFSLLLMDELPRAFGVPEAGARAARGTPDWVHWVEQEWEALRPFQDMVYGFYVKPRLGFDDLVAYCRHPQSRQDVKDEMVAHLVSSVTTRPQLPEIWEEAAGALRRLFMPVLESTVRKLCNTAGMDADEARAAVDTEFEEAVDEYDVFWAERPAAYYPFGTLRQMAFRQSAAQLGSPTRTVPTRWVPFAQ